MYNTLFKYLISTISCAYITLYVLYVEYADSKT